MLGRLVALTAAERLEAFPALERGREDLLPAGILLFQEIMRLGRYDSFIVSEGSLLDGILHADDWPGMVERGVDS
ncbi:MAG: hypothetical protein M5R36_22840 [Deltaproteobacteria bacterium]|nr:hypothetical protein [Deltaproteobacteria bacterium]